MAHRDRFYDQCFLQLSISLDFADNKLPMKDLQRISILSCRFSCSRCCTGFQHEGYHRYQSHAIDHCCATGSLEGSDALPMSWTPIVTSAAAHPSRKKPPIRASARLLQ